MNIDLKETQDLVDRKGSNQLSEVECSTAHHKVIDKNKWTNVTTVFVTIFTFVTAHRFRKSKMVSYYFYQKTTKNLHFFYKTPDFVTTNSPEYTLP